MARLCKPTSPRRRATVAVLVAVSLVTLLLCASLAIDVGYICALTGEAQNNADAAALAGASAIRDGDPTAVEARALQFLTLNQATQGFYSPDNQTIEVGQWDCSSNGFVLLADPADPSANAVRVVSRRDGVSLFFAPLMGHNTTSVSREAIAMVALPCQGIWGLSSLSIPGNVMVDSFDSTVGAYDPATAGDEGNVCSGGDIFVAGSTEINGDAMPGLGYSLTIDGANAVVSGATCPQATSATPPPIDFDDVSADNDNDTIGLTDDGTDPFADGSNLVITGNDNLTLAPGTYYFNAFEFDSNSTLTLTGPTTIYLVGDFGASGAGTINTTTNPADLTIMSSGSVVNISGNVDFYGSIYAPNATVTMSGSGNFYGSIVGNTVTITGNFEFHVDESLTLDTWFPPSPPILVK